MTNKMDTFWCRHFGSRLEFISGPVKHMWFSVLYLINCFVARSIHRGGPSWKRDASPLCRKWKANTNTVKGSFVLLRKRMNCG